jgi:uncharacterized membrane protein
VAIGVNNFLVSLLDSHDYSTLSLQFPGFLLVSLAYRFIEINKLPDKTAVSILNVFFKHFYSQETHTFNITNFIHLFLRAINFFGLIWLCIISSHYAVKAQINFGIISTCMSIQTPLNCVIGVMAWGEKLKIKMILGTTVIIAGVIWVSLARGSDSGGYSDEAVHS